MGSGTWRRSEKSPSCLATPTEFVTPCNSGREDDRHEQLRQRHYALGCRDWTRNSQDRPGIVDDQRARTVPRREAAGDGEGRDGATRLWDTTKGEQVATLLSVNDGGDWLVVTPDGLFDGIARGVERDIWRFSENTFDVAPVEVFFNEY